ncbi:LuxR C-terminal-related transcriptional regulator [Actinoplanes sp. L3-i22]|uniref:LuxR C-terminal-related transcriptional regulator n=1 Tax=Actinoplanes sp. L3-i22 TaxID=2836373 RepID=UPI001C75D49F|nr:LuxR C-terminal-related transcriptional regulator [Actinoplanes sp. L3-i22]BCY10715.1 hypothetical protein L3i22_058030 [Actinoplanes sp. L3-i22]
MDDLGLISIGSAATAAGVPPWQLRSWEDAGLLTPVRAANGYRLYSPADVRRAIELRTAAGSTNRLGVFAAHGDERPAAPATAALTAAPPPADGRKMRILRRLAHAIRHVDDLDHVLATALDSALGMVNAQIGALSYADIATQRYVLAAHRGLSDAYVRGIDTWNLHEGLAGEAFGLREPLTIADLSTNSTVSREVVHAERLRGYVCVPLLRGQRRLGIVEVFDREPRVFSADDVQSLELIGACVSSIVESMVLTQELRFLRAERAKVLREWTVQALSAADTERAELVRVLRAEADVLAGTGTGGPAAARVRSLAGRIESAEREWVDMVPLIREQIVDGWSEHARKRVHLEVADWPATLPLELTTRLYLLMHSLVALAVRAAESRVTLRLSGDDQVMWIQVCDDRAAAPSADQISSFAPEVVSSVKRLGGSLITVRDASGLLGVRVLLPLSAARPEGHALTARERHVLEALSVGTSNRVIAADLGISPKTLQNHLTAIYRKLGVTSRAQAVRFLR